MIQFGFQWLGLLKQISIMNIYGQLVVSAGYVVMVAVGLWSAYVTGEKDSGGFAQDCSYSSALAIGLLQSCTKLLTWAFDYYFYVVV